jgi:protoheme IX farnesyltransferase
VVAIALNRSQTSDFVELTKPRIVVLVMLTAAAGFWMAAPPLSRTLTLFHVLLGTVLVAAGTNALNQIWERDVDALMRRTRLRPMPAGRLNVAAASLFAWVCGVGGVIYLGAFVNTLTAALAAATLVSYVFLYTPLKRRTTVATLIGAVPGALPIVGGWTAATGSVSPEMWVLFWILFLWQMPHFLALGWMYRDDYARAGLSMVSVNDPDGRGTFMYSTLYAAALLPVSLAPTLLGMTGSVYFIGATALSVWFLMASVAAARSATAANARRLFQASLAYLPVLLILMAADRVV